MGPQKEIGMWALSWDLKSMSLAERHWSAVGDVFTELRSEKANDTFKEKVVK